MLNAMFKGLFDSDLTTVIGVGEFLLCMGCSLLIGLILAAGYMYRSRYTKSFILTLALLPTVGIVTTVPLLFYAVGIRVTPMSLAGIMMYINPTLQLLISVLLYHEEFTTTHAILFVFVWSGLALYLAAGWLAGRERGKENAACE